MPLTSFTQEEENEWIRTKGALTHEMCEFRLKELDAKAEPIRLKMAESKAIVLAKVKGQIRINQVLIKGYKQQLASLQYQRERYYNGGIL